MKQKNDHGTISRDLGEKEQLIGQALEVSR